MSLDLAKTVPQINDSVSYFKSRSAQASHRLKTAIHQISMLKSDKTQIPVLQKKIQNSKAVFTLADLTDTPGKINPAATANSYIAIGTDGSQIEVDRHRPMHCYLINIGGVHIQYGDAPSARLWSTPHMFSKDEDLTIKADGDASAQSIEEELLGIKRDVMELEALVNTAKSITSDIPILGLVDGSLIRWPLVSKSYPDFVKRHFLDDGYLVWLDEARELMKGKRFAIASYTSMPRYTDVVNNLRLMNGMCTFEKADCNVNCKTTSRGNRPCDGVDGVLDREVFEAILDTGERSAVYKSRASVVREQYGDHQISFFYLNTGDEIARIEVPVWIADDEESTSMVHSLVMDQCKKGRGYPVVLSEAHEQAVVSHADAERFWDLLENAMDRAKAHRASSAKSISKRHNWV
ncbi:MAG: DNA double-strand break repair nuclease NurA [Dehalococcoidia bacterium]|nr:DNA double-strand break repair nuclease NurA [Dehalococcoidia bacterium]